MMEEYIVTFYSHFGAMDYKKKCVREGITAKIMPVPRSLSSSCGTCVKCVGLPDDRESEEVEMIVRICADGQYEIMYNSL